MRIGVVSAGVLPIPPVKGGAVENLVRFYLDYNEKYLNNNFIVFSIFDKAISAEIIKNYKKTKFIYIKIPKVLFLFENYVDSICIKILKINFKKIYLRRVTSLIKGFDFDYLILENRPEFVVSVSDVNNSKVILHLHNDDLNLNTLNAKEIFNNTKMIFCVSEYIKLRVSSIENNEKIKVLLNGIDTNRFMSSNSDRKAIRDKLKFKETDFVVCFSGRICKEKGIKELLQAFSLITNMNNIKLLILGSRFYGNYHHKSSFQKELELLSKPMKDRIIFSGFVDYEKMPDYLSAADISVIPSLWEDPFPLTVLESLSIGLPLIVSESGGIPEMVDNSSAIIIKRDSQFIFELKNAILKLKDDKDLREKLSKNGRKRSLSFSKDKYCNEFFNLLE